MRPVSSTMLSYIQNPGSFRSEFLIVLNARDRSTGANYVVGFWTGDTNEAFVVGGSSIIFYGAGALIEPPEIVYSTGLEVLAVDVKFSPLSEGFNAAVRLYDVRQQQCVMYRAYFDNSTEALIEEPQRIFKGRVNTAPISDGEEGSTSEAVLTVVSSSRDLTRTFAAKHSDSTFKKRSGDRLLRYSDTAGSVAFEWGTA